VLSADSRPVLEPILVTDGHVLVPPVSTSHRPVLTPLSECFFEDRDTGGGCDGVGGCAFVAGTRLSAGFRGDDEVSEDGVPHLAGDEIGIGDAT